MTDTDTMWNALPAVVPTYLSAHQTRDVAAALSTFTADAAVTDEGHTVAGRQAIGAWLDDAGSEYTFTTTFTGATVSGPEHIDVVQRLEGDFPGGVADLHYRFTLAGDLISRLVIEP
ncbi:nuclear transport factor 2-like protein [Mycolicibacterium psychrotolerans]|uniref:SnoaL-like domain-containing protein n=1 Tax=Mycolicibacterium psychrotolerans TaxID=216929 RepID=A0A7I7M594_9MYCO|nr:nuclear transport factor 2 family protein [Mycolicibacterium psychrotolerans]BBX67047.1 hypothetical protein MPSYJ_05080 [Mycolicibacterium psychrotolerans]